MSMTFSTMAMHSTLWGASNAGDPLSTQGNWGGGPSGSYQPPPRLPRRKGQCWAAIWGNLTKAGQEVTRYEKKKKKDL